MKKEDHNKSWGEVEDERVLHSIRPWCLILISKKYDTLLKVLSQAFRRASQGKGAQRHGDDKEFTDQWILRGLRLFGLGGVQFQIGKKNEELCNLPEIKDKVNELLDIIVYAAAGVIYLQEKAENEEGSMH